MTAPQTPTESRWQLFYRELKYLCHNARDKRYLKREKVRAMRRNGKKLEKEKQQ